VRRSRESRIVYQVGLDGVSHVHVDRPVVFLLVTRLFVRRLFPSALSCCDTVQRPDLDIRTYIASSCALPVQS
jgi:hypothetical protein